MDDEPMAPTGDRPVFLPPSHDDAPPAAPAPPATPPPLSRWLSSPDPFDAPRPTPTLRAMVAVGGGLLVAAGLFSLLDELDGYDQRAVGLAISLLFLALGVALSTINRSTRSANAGVAISALAVVPLVVFAFANADVFARFSNGGVEGGNPYDGLRGVVTLMLLAAAALWLLGYILGPGRRYGFYLGAALLAIWLIPTMWIQISAIEDQFAALGSFNSSSTFDSGFDSGSDPFGSDFDSTDQFDTTDPFGSPGQFDTFDTFDEPEITDPSTKLGVVSLCFGAVYLAFAGWRDRRRDVRMATAVLVPALIVLLGGLSQLNGHIGWFGESALGIAVGSAILAVGLRGQRRLSSWLGLFVATVGVGSIVLQSLQDSPRAAGGVLTVLGIAIALAVGRTDKRPAASDPAPAPEPGPWPGPTAPTAPGAGWAPSFAPPPTAPSAGAPGFTAPTPPPETPGTPGSPPVPPGWSRPF